MGDGRRRNVYKNGRRVRSLRLPFFRFFVYNSYTGCWLTARFFFSPSRRAMLSSIWVVINFSRIFVKPFQGCEKRASLPSMVST
jgi:hypothetical protein